MLDGFVIVAVLLGLWLAPWCTAAYAAWVVFREIYWMVNPADLKGEVAVMTGGGSGIGRLVALKLAAAGCNVAVWDLNLETAKETAAECKKLGVEAVALEVDVTDVNVVTKAAEETRGKLGNVTILINNAGIVIGKKIQVIPPKAAQKTLEVNTLAHIFTVQAFLPAMLEQNRGQIITVASAAGLTGIAGMVDYCASKYAAIGFHDSLRLELRHLGKTGISTTLVCPYYIKTGMFEGLSPNKLAAFLIPMLEPDYVGGMIFNAIQRREEFLCMPRMVYIVPVLKATLPSIIADAISDLFGLSGMMDSFKQTRPQTENQFQTKS